MSYYQGDILVTDEIRVAAEYVAAEAWEYNIPEREVRKPGNLFSNEKWEMILTVAENIDHRPTRDLYPTFM